MSRVWSVLLLLAGFVPMALAQTPPPAPLTDQERAAEIHAAVDDAYDHGVNGPAEVRLLDQARLAIPQDMAFIPPPQAARVMRAFGNQAGDDLVGLVFGNVKTPWVVVIRSSADGYVKDDDATDWKADDLLADLRQGTEDGNADRIARGFPPLEVAGWLQPPAYDAADHRLSWALILRKKGAPDSGSETINYNTRALGRAGYFSINLLTTRARIDADKPVALTLLANLQYDQGKRYQDFNASTDHIAEYGLAALLGVVAAKKLGLIALAGAFLLKFAKVGALAVAGLFYGAAKIFRRKPKPEA